MKIKFICKVQYFERPIFLMVTFDSISPKIFFSQVIFHGSKFWVCWKNYDILETSNNWFQLCFIFLFFLYCFCAQHKCMCDSEKRFCAWKKLFGKNFEWLFFPKSHQSLTWLSTIAGGKIFVTTLEKNWIQCLPD
mgnify:CR=1 FL=1